MLRKKHVLKGKNVIGGRDQKVLRERCLRLYGVCDAAAELLSGGLPHAESVVGVDEGVVEVLAAAFFPKNAQCVQLKWQYAGSGNVHVLLYLVNTVPLCMECVSLAGLDDNNVSLLANVPPSFLAPTLFGFLRFRHVVGEHHKALQAAALNTGSLVAVSGDNTPCAELSLCPLEPCAYLSPLVLHRDVLVVWVNEATPSFVMRGAHLMGAGVQYISWTGAAGGRSDDRLPPRRLDVGSLAYVCVRDNPTPFAIGIVTRNLADTFNNPAYTHVLPAPRYPTTTEVRFLNRGGVAALDGPGVFVLASVGDLLWESHLHDYQVFCTAKLKLGRDSTWIVPELFRAATTNGGSGGGGGGGGGGGANIPSLPGVDLFGFRLAAKAAALLSSTTDACAGEPHPDGDAAPDPLANCDADAAHPTPVDNAVEGPSAPYDAEQAVVDVEGVEADTPDAAVDWWGLFPTAESMLIFALCEAVRSIMPSKLPVPVTSFVNSIAQCLPRGLPPSLPPAPPNSEHQAAADEDSAAFRLALASSHAIDWKKTSFKKALSMLTATPEIREMVVVREAKRGVHEVSKVSKSCALMSLHKRTFREFLMCAHQPAVDEEQEQSAMEAALRQLGGGADTPLALKVQSELRIESIDYLYRPQGGLHPPLLRMLTKRKWDAPKEIAWPQLGEAAPQVDPEPSNETDSDDDEEEEAGMPGLVSLKILRDHLRAYARDQGLMEAASGTAGGPPEIRIDLLLRHLWPATTRDIPTAMPLLALDRLVEQRFCPMYVLRYAANRIASSSMGRYKLKNGRPPLVHLYTEKRAGNKIVTVVRGLDAYGFSLEALAVAWKSKFATSVSVVDPVKRDNLTLKSGTKVPMEIQLQGAQPVEAHLVGTMGLPKSLLALKK